MQIRETGYGLFTLKIALGRKQSFIFLLYILLNKGTGLFNTFQLK